MIKFITNLFEDLDDDDNVLTVYKVMFVVGAVISTILFGILLTKFTYEPALIRLTVFTSIACLPMIIYTYNKHKGDK